MTYQAEARIVCHVMGANANVTIGKHDLSKDTHPHFDNGLAIIRRIFEVVPAAVGEVANDDIDECIAAAKNYIGAELPVAFTIDETPVNALELRGHAWRDGQWVPTNPAYVGYAFRLQYTEEDIERPSTCKVPIAGTDQPLILRWYVHVQPR